MPKLSVRHLISKAESLVKKGEHLRAKELYELVLKDYPKNNRARTGLSRILAIKKNDLDTLIPEAVLTDIGKSYTQQQYHSVVSKIENLIGVYPKMLIP